MTRGLIPAACYLGIGAMLHAIFYQTHFDFHSALTWLWLFGWPIVVFTAIGIVWIVIFLAVLIAAAFVALFQ